MRKLSLIALLIVSMLLPSTRIITVQATSDQLKIYTRDEGSHENNIEKPRICIENIGTTSISNFTMYYYFTVEDNKTPLLELYYQTDPNITNLQSLGNGNYKVKITPHMTLAPGEKNEGFVFGLHYGDWSFWDKTNDFSHISTSTYVLNPRVVVVDSNGNIIYGEEMPLKTSINVTNTSTSGVTGFIDVHTSNDMRKGFNEELANFCQSPIREYKGGPLTWYYPSIKSFYVVMPKDAVLNMRVTSSSIQETTNYRSTLGVSLNTIEPYQNRNYPQNLFEEVFSTNVEGVSLALVKVNPIQYNPIEDKLTEYKRIEFEFDFVGGSGFNMPDGQYRDIINNTVINPQISATPETFLQRERGEILIVSNNRFSTGADSPVARLALWKRQMGFDVTVETRSSWTSSEVQAFIAGRASNPPDYIILFGDNQWVESKQMGNYNPNWPSAPYYYSDAQYYFDESSVSNKLPLSATARIPVDTVLEANNVVDKIISMEKQPPTSDLYYKNILTGALFQDETTDNMIFGNSQIDGYEDLAFTRTIWEIGQYLTTYHGKQVDRLYRKQADTAIPRYWNNSMLHFGEALPSDLLDPSFNWLASGADSVASLNNGRMFGIYRGHGSSSEAPTKFSITDVSDLNNSGVLPVLFFINCLSGAFCDYTGTSISSISTELIKKQGSGAVGVLAATRESLSGSNDAFAKSLINAMWPNPGVPATFRHIIDYDLVSANANPKPMNKIGYVILQGHIQSKQTWDGTRMSYDDGCPLQVYHYYGDPSMDMNLELPASISAAMPDTVDVKARNYSVYWSSLTEGVVTLSIGDNVVSTSEITSQGTAVLLLPSGLIPSGTTTPATVTVTSKNCRPLIKNIVITNS